MEKRAPLKSRDEIIEASDEFLDLIRKGNLKYLEDHPDHTPEVNHDRAKCEIGSSMLTAADFLPIPYDC